MTMPSSVLSRLGPVVPGLANRPGGSWDVTQYGLNGDGTTDNTAALVRLAYRAQQANAALVFPAGVYWIKDWRQLGWSVAGQLVMVSQRWISTQGAIIRTSQALDQSEVQWHGLWASGITWQAPNAPGEKLFGGGSRNLLFESCIIQDCAPAFLDGPDEYVTFYGCLFNSTAAYIAQMVGGYGPCIGQIQQTIGNVHQHFTVDSCSFQFAPHGQAGSLISLEGSGLIGDYLINNNHLLTDNLPDYLIDAGIDVEPHQNTPITDVTITNNYIWNTRIYIAGVTTAEIAYNTHYIGSVAMNPAPYAHPYCGNVNYMACPPPNGSTPGGPVKQYCNRGKTSEPALGPAILGYSSWYPGSPTPASGTISIHNNQITYGRTINKIPAVPFSFGQGGRIAHLSITDNTITQAAGAKSVPWQGALVHPVIAYLEPGTIPGGWGQVTFSGNTIHWAAQSAAQLVQVNLGQNDATQITITANRVLVQPNATLATLTGGYNKNTDPGATADTSTVTGNSPAIANTTIRTYVPFKGAPPGAGSTISTPATPWYQQKRVWAGVGVVGLGGYGVWAWKTHRWPFH